MLWATSNSDTRARPSRGRHAGASQRRGRRASARLRKRQSDASLGSCRHVARTSVGRARSDRRGLLPLPRRRGPHNSANHVLRHCRIWRKSGRRALVRDRAADVRRGCRGTAPLRPPRRHPRLTSSEAKPGPLKRSETPVIPGQSDFSASHNPSRPDSIPGRATEMALAGCSSQRSGSASRVARQDGDAHA
jgi:hypothetical protein